MTFPGFRRIRAEFRRLHAYQLGCCAILLYHRIADESADPWDLCVSPAHFVNHLDALRSSGYTPVSLREFAEQRRSRCRRVVLTFDDGYSDNLHAALPILEAQSCPATFFVTAGAIGSLQAFWWDELQALVFAPQRLPNRLRITLEGLPTLEFDLEDNSSKPSGKHSVLSEASQATSAKLRHSLYMYLYSRLAPIPALRQAALQRCWAWAGIEARSMPRLIMNDLELLALSRSGIAEVGSHGWSHERLPDLDTASRRHEIFASRERLRTMTGASVYAFSYPHGAYSSQTIELTRSAGYRYACISSETLVKPSAECLALPRMQVGNWTGQQLVDLLRCYF
jgi:peptidoglycan/xylan/chitin deacetylase (PgdA/CDA1 family)